MKHIAADLNAIINEIIKEQAAARNKGVYMSRQSYSSDDFVTNFIANPRYSITWLIGDDEDGGCLLFDTQTNRKTKWQYDDLSGQWNEADYGYDTEDDGQLVLPVGKSTDPKVCNHIWALYDSGLTQYDYCINCDKRKDDE